MMPAAPNPCATRARISTGKVDDNAQSTEAMVNTTSPQR